MSNNHKATVNTDETSLAETLKDRVKSCRRIVERNDDMQPLAVQAEDVLEKSARLLDAERSNRGENLVLAILSLGRLQEKPPAISEYAGGELNDRLNEQASTIEQVRGELGVCQTGIFAAGKRIARAGSDVSRSFSCVFEEQGWLFSGFIADRIVVRWNGSQRLTNVFLAVSLVGATGESRTNLHFVPVIAPGDVLYGHYPSGFTQGAIRVGRQTVRNARTVKIDVWCDEGITRNLSADVRRVND